MAGETCAKCGGPLTPGYVATTNGSGLFWATERSDSRLRPTGLEVIVPTGFQGTYSANVAAGRCPNCRTILLAIPK